MAKQVKNTGKKQSSKKTTKPKTEYKAEEPKVEFALGKQNYFLLIIGFAIIMIGFMLMVGGGSENPNVFNEDEIFSFRRITLAPIVVLFGFVFEIWAIMKKPKEEITEA